MGTASYVAQHVRETEGVAPVAPRPGGKDYAIITQLQVSGRGGFSRPPSPLKVLKSHDLRPANNLAVDTCGVFGSLILFGAGFLGPRGCFWNLESFTLLASI